MPLVGFYLTGFLLVIWGDLFWVGLVHPGMGFSGISTFLAEQNHFFLFAFLLKAYGYSGLFSTALGGVTIVFGSRRHIEFAISGSVVFGQMLLYLAIPFLVRDWTAGTVFMCLTNFILWIGVVLFWICSIRLPKGSK